MIVGNQIYSSLSLLARQSMLCSLNCQEWLQCLSYFSSLNTVKVILVTCMMMPELRGITTVYATGSAFEKLLALNSYSFILTVGIIGVAIYNIEGGGYKVFDSHARDMYGNSHSEGTCVLLEIKSMHKLVQYFQSLYGNEDIMSLKVYILPTLKLIFFQAVLNIVVY